MNCGHVKGVGHLIEVKTLEEPSLGLCLLAAKGRWPFNKWLLNRGSTVFSFTHTNLCVASKVLSYHATAPLEEANKLKVILPQNKHLRKFMRLHLTAIVRGCNPDKLLVTNFV